eukprot:scaffold19.g1864.t1
MAPQSFLLFESASGYALYQVDRAEELSGEALQATVGDLARFGKSCSLVAFKPFTSAADALEQINAVSESQATDALRTFLSTNLPKVKKEGKAKFRLGVSEAKLGSAIQEETGIPCECNEQTGELLRGVRLHFTTFVKGLAEGDLAKAQLGLAHSYSRAKVKFNVNKADNMIIQARLRFVPFRVAIALLDTLDKDVNTFVMRVREWYSWHFPELVKIVNDNYQYAQLALLIKDKGSLGEEKLEALKEVVGEEDKAREILEVEERLRFYEEGVAPRKNLDVMQEVIGKLQEATAPAEGEGAAEGGKKKKKEKKEKKDKKRPAEEEPAAAAAGGEEEPKKKKKKKKEAAAA